jgi:PAN domain
MEITRCRPALYAALLGWAMGGCAAETDAEPDDAEQTAEPPVATQQRALKGGTATTLHPEIGYLKSPAVSGGLTATLIAPSVFVTAGVATGFSSVVSGGTLTLGDGVARAVAKMFSFGPAHDNVDLAVGFLEAPVPTTVAIPAQLSSTSAPGASASLTLVGYGCSATMDDDGVKRYHTTASSLTNTFVACLADAGGPVFFGGIDTPAPVIVTSLLTNFGFTSTPVPDLRVSVAPYRARIEALVQAYFGGLEPGWERPGLTYKSVRASSASLCQRQCGSDATCRAFSWRASTNACDLKSATTDFVPNGDVTSGVPPEYVPGDDTAPSVSVTTVTSPTACRDACVGMSSCRAYVLDRSDGTLKCHLKKLSGSYVASGSLRAVGYRRRLDGNVRRVFSAPTVSQTTTPGQCASLASQEGHAAFSWAPPERCERARDAGVASVSPGSSSGARRGLEPNFDRWGNDLPGEPHKISADPVACQTLCATTAACAAWTYVPAQRRSGFTLLSECWLKSAAGTRTGEVTLGLVSGLKGGELF